MILIEKSDPDTPESLYLIEMLSATLAEITGDSGKTNFNIDTMKSDRALWVVAKDENGEAIGCGAIRPISENIAELKRMFSVNKASGTGTALLRYLEGEAKSLGYNEIRLETRKVNSRAVAFYVKHNYQRIANYGPYVGKDEAVCFSKHLSLKEI
ncbi:GNAT family N-acetyltransferase [Klebsiella michiganensis]|uniref:GNAT family N-acetyltransferase n=1 Tax=Klebsiella michiganensis TaxID=1134687 RepID=UPI00259FA7B7|nr:GNAT family N-acetyltransferase [Klebsiella michiganensis]MDM4165174.1 GNAT family N-acetyltransferase [Klebsiella michiganensis]HBM3157195.1 GNAT family N-acetyltransferase [Klebsiella michiganensis]HCQ8235879.1 GNAT family N-acetyltransferase [Klebsiella michiganensis]